LISIHYDKTIDSVDDLGDVFLEIGKKLIESGHRAGAFLAVDVALLLNKSGQLVLKEFAKHCFSKGSYDSCIKSLEKGLRLGAVESETLHLMGKCYEHLGMEEASELCYQQERSLFRTQ
jgi:Flp pilus assembly protein TadD